MIRYRHLMLAALAATAAADALVHDWIFSSLFFFSNPHWQIFVMAGAPFALIAAASWIAGRWMQSRSVLRLVDSLSVLLLVAFGYTWLRQQGLLTGGLSTPVRFMWFLGGMVGAWLLPRMLSEDTSARLRMAVITFGVIFLAGPVMYGKLKPDDGLGLGGFFTASATAQTPNTVVLILDELSATGAGPIIHNLQQGGRMVFAREVRSSGEHTISAIPSLLIGLPFENARVCAPSALCGSTGMFDFSRQHVTRANVNIVGFFHPYCKMQGLSYCATYAVNGFSSVVLHYGCNVAALFSGGQRFELCESALRPFEKAAQVRTDIRARALAAPFWTNGGTLYIHTMLPHPPGNIAGNSLEVDYANNLQQAARFATDLIGRLETTFGQDYLLVITSDHPLRPTVWCGTYRYHEAGCLEGGRFNSTKVPLIAVGQGAHSLMDLQSNLDLLNRLTLIH